MTDNEMLEELPAPGQTTLFGADDDFKLVYQLWRGMPSFNQENLEPWKTLIVSFESLPDYEEFKRAIDQPNLTLRSRSTWYPYQAWDMVVDVKRWISREP